MKVFAMSRLFAELTASTCKYTHAIISITDPKSDTVKFAENEKRIALLQQVFYDIDLASKTIETEGDIRKIYEAGLFTNEQAREIVAFVKQYQDSIQILIVHCTGGISRSSGVAAAILKATTGSDEKIFKDPMFIPNMWVYRKVLNAFMEANDG